MTISSSSIRFSVIIPVGRPGPDADRAIASVLGQTHHGIELILAVEERLATADERVTQIVVSDRNPAVRRNRAADAATGEWLAFLDDDAIAPSTWLETAARLIAAHPDTIVWGGPDPAPPDSGIGELLSETLLAAPLIGSGVLAHVGPEGERRVTSAHDLALVNLFVRRDRFTALGGFSEEIGYVGEDSELLARLLLEGEIRYDSRLRVHHRRRPFPGPYLAQRWRYRVKTGRLMVHGPRTYRRNPKILLFLSSGALWMALLIIAPVSAAILLAAYLALVTILGIRVTRLPWRWRALIPVAFAMHHAVYFAGIVTGAVSALGAAERNVTD